MTLFKCWICKKEMSTEDRSCSRCGFTFSTEQNDNTLPVDEDKEQLSEREKLILFILLAVICFITGYFIGREHLKYEIRSGIRSVFEK